MELFQLPKAFLQMNTIFISILIEALPFVLIGVFISGFIQMFVTEDMVAKWMPKKSISVCFNGYFFRDDVSGV